MTKCFKAINAISGTDSKHHEPPAAPTHGALLSGLAFQQIFKTFSLHLTRAFIQLYSASLARQSIAASMTE
jgi:hypothetical protein